jgi:hypothetical protein
MGRKKSKFKEYTINGMSYLTGCLKGEWWCCKIWRRQDTPDVFMEYVWGETEYDVLLKKGYAGAENEGFLPLQPHPDNHGNHKHYA